MGDGIFKGATLDLLKRSLDAYALRQRVIAENVANVETPGYRSREVVFEELLADAMGERGATPMRRTQTGHQPAAVPGGVAPSIREASAGTMDNGINNVNMDHEMAALAETNLSHKMAARLLAARYEKLRSAIRGRSSA